MSFGGTKNGCWAGEAIVVFEPGAFPDLEVIKSRAGHTFSKSRFVAAQFEAYLADNNWLKTAGHANAMAQRLHEALRDVPGVQVLHPPQANAVFAVLPAAAIERLYGQGWRFYQFIAGGGCRLMCAWDTTEQAVDEFAADVRAACASCTP